MGCEHNVCFFYQVLVDWILRFIVDEELKMGGSIEHESESASVPNGTVPGRLGKFSARPFGTLTVKVLGQPGLGANPGIFHRGKSS